MTRGQPKEIVEFNPEPERLIRKSRKREKFKVEASSSGLEEGQVRAEMENIPHDNPAGDPPPPNPIVQHQYRGRMDDPPRTNSDFARPNLTEITSSIVRPRVEANNFELKPSVIRMVQQNAQFDGLEDQDPSTHIQLFLELCDTFKFNGVSEDAIRLRLFPFSLAGKARQWLITLPKECITTWDELVRRFVDKYFPPSKTAKLRANIQSF